MPKDSDRPTPIPTHVQRAIAGRVDALEQGQGQLLGEVGAFGEWRESAERRIRGVEVVVAAQSNHDGDDDDDRTSQADLSLHPTRGRVSLKRVPPWAIAAIFLVAIAATAIVLIVWLVKR